MPQGFPQFDLARRQSPDLALPDRSAAGAGALGQLGADADRLGGQLQDMVDTAAKSRGQAAAAADVQAGAVTPRDDGTVAGAAYNAVAKNYLGASRQAALSVDMQKAYEANPQNPEKLGPALDAVIQGYSQSSTGFADLDTELSGHYLVRRADFLARATAGAQAAIVAQDKANYETEVSTGADLLDQTAAGASSDAGGGQRITDAAQLFVRGLSKYGPREAFDVAGQHFDADPGRRGSIQPDDMAKIYTQALSKARATWILSSAQTLPDEMSRKMFASQVMEKWKAGDPSFAGIDGPEMDRLQDKLHAAADRARADDHAAKTEFEQKARQGIDAFTWGSDVDFDEVAANARASGNQALIAQADFYRNADVHTRGVLRTVVQRQLGLIGQTGPENVLVDANGAPVGNDAEAVAGQIKPDPKAFFSRLVGQPVEITSAKRTPEHNTAVHGSATSEHLTGDAWDIVVPGMSSAQVFAKLAQAGVPHDQLADEHSHVHFGLGPQMRNQNMVKGEGGAWTIPPDVKAGTPQYLAWASAQEGFSTDPLKYARGGTNRAAIANVPVLVPQGGLMEGQPLASWQQALAKRYTLGQGLAKSYGVPPRMLDNGEVEFYKSEIAADPMAGIKIAQNAMGAVGPQGAQALLRELGQTGPVASVNLHLADLTAMGAGTIALRAAQGLQLQSQGRHLTDADKHALDTAFDQVRGAVPPTVLTAAYATAHAAMIADGTQGAVGDPAKYRDGALGGTTWQGRFYGGSADLNGAKTVLPPWLNADHAGQALQALGDHWRATGRGPVWSNGQAATGEQLAHMQLSLQPSGVYRFVNPRTGNPLMRQGGGAFAFDADQARSFLGQTLGLAAVRPAVVSSR